MSRRLWGAAAPLLALVAGLAFTGTAGAQAGNPFGCTATGAAVTLLGQNVLPGATSANAANVPCASASATLGQTPVSTIPGLSLSVGPVSAQTTLGTSRVTGSTVDTGATATSSLDALNLALPGLSIAVTNPSQATVDYECVNDQLVTNASSTLSAITINGNTVSLDGLPQDLSIPGTASILVNQQASTSTSDTETLLQIQLLGDGFTLTLGQAQASMAQSGGCAGTSNGSTGGGGGVTGGGGSSGAVSGCPTGATSSSGICVVTGTSIAVPSASSAEIAGAKVISLAQARRLYGKHTSCLNGAGPKYVVVGTKRTNKITVRKVRMRVLGLGGNDHITVVGGPRTCVNGGAGNDVIVNKQRNFVTAFGSNGKDRITLGNGPAFVLGGKGNDHIVAGNGKANLQGNAGDDYLKAGNGPARLNGGNGNDVLIAGTGKAHLNGGKGDNRLTAHGKAARVAANPHSQSVAYVRKSDVKYARRHGVKTVHVIK